EPEQVARRAFEVQRATVDALVFQQTGGIPAGKFSIGQVRDAFAHARLDVVGAEGEIEQNAAHALALELQRPASIGGQVGPIQRRTDISFGGMELTGVDE
ncbi:MAG: hypothetical protein ABI389_10880, partial [Rhodanobacter sp.]